MFELLFILLILAGLFIIGMAAFFALQGRRRIAASLFTFFFSAAAIYLGAVVVVSLLSPQRVLAIGQDWCFDDWCVAVEEVSIVPELGHEDEPILADGVFYLIRLSLSNHARGRPQRASSAAVFMLDKFGNRYDISQEGQAAYEALVGPLPPLTSTVPVGQSVYTVMVFDIPKDIRDIGLTVEHPVGFSPGLFIIGDQASLFHKPTIIQLP